jgi:hypothetical protein
MPVQQVAPAPDPRRVGKAPAARATPTVAAAEPRPDGALRPISDAEALAATAPTPLLDAAIARAQDIQAAATGAGAPAPAPAVAPVSEVLAAAEPPRDDALVQTAAVADTGPIRAAEVEPLPPAPPIPPAPVPAPEPPPAPAPVPPEEAWRSHFEALRAVVREREAASDGEPWPLRAAVLDWLGDGRPSGADARTTLWTALAEALAQASARAEGPAGAADPALREAITALEANLPLTVGTLALCRKVQGFGQYEPLAEPSCRAGQTVVVYCELDGLRYEPEADGARLRSRLESTVELRAAEGDRVVWSQALGTAEDVCRRRRRDYYVNYRLTLPDAAALPPGAYRLRVHQRDAMGGNEATAEIPLTIAAPPNG